MYWDVPRGASYGEKVMRKFKYTIKEEQGIHARPASFLIQEARTYESRITLRVKGKEADASNIIAVMALDAVSYTHLNLNESCSKTEIKSNTNDTDHCWNTPDKVVNSAVNGFYCF